MADRMRDDDGLPERRDFKNFLIALSRDPAECPTARGRALMACLVLPEPIQKLIVEAGALDSLLDSIEKTIITAEDAARKCRSCGTPLGSNCPKCQRLWES